MLGLGLVTLVWAIEIGPSQAQQGAMQNCPQAGKWAISAWSGDDGTETGQVSAMPCSRRKCPLGNGRKYPEHADNMHSGPLLAVS